MRNFVFSLFHILQERLELPLCLLGLQWHCLEHQGNNGTVTHCSPWGTMGHDWGNNGTVYLIIKLEKLQANLNEEFCLFVVPHFIGASRITFMSSRSTMALSGTLGKQWDSDPLFPIFCDPLYPVAQFLKQVSFFNKLLVKCMQAINLLKNKM